MQGNYLSMAELEDLMGKVMDSYGEDLVHAEVIGYSIDDRPITAYSIFSRNPTLKPNEDQALRESILLTAVHHARELTTISQVVLEMLSILYRYESGDRQTIALLENAAIIIIPVMNPDGVSLIDQAYQRTGKLSYYRKNGRTWDRRCSEAIGYGVDINRNYSFKFAFDEDGSSSDPCD